MKTITIVISLIILSATALAYPKIVRKIEIEEIKENNITAMTKIAEEPSTTAYLEVPFICQAPLETSENWKYHEESCEEAALLQAYAYQTGQEISKEEANEIILDMITWQEKEFGGHFDLYAQEMKTFINGYYQIPEESIKIINNATLEDIKTQLNQNKPIIAPITGEILQNPYYPYPGYHMPTIIGYTNTNIITNDNGTRHGQNFSYPIEIFMQALQDAGGDILTLEI